MGTTTGWIKYESHIHYLVFKSGKLCVEDVKPTKYRKVTQLNSSMLTDVNLTLPKYAVDGQMLMVYLANVWSILLKRFNAQSFSSE